MRRMRMAGTVAAGACAAALTVSLAACTSVGKSAGAPFATIFPSAGTAPAHAPGSGSGSGSGSGVRIGSGSGHAAGSNRAGRVRAATLSRNALADPDAIAAGDSDVWVANSDYESDGRGWVSEFNAASGALVRVIASPHDGLTDPQALAVDEDRVLGGRRGRRRADRAQRRHRGADPGGGRARSTSSPIPRRSRWRAATSGSRTAAATRSPRSTPPPAP